MVVVMKYCAARCSLHFAHTCGQQLNSYLQCRRSRQCHRRQKRPLEELERDERNIKEYNTIVVMPTEMAVASSATLTEFDRGGNRV